MPAYERQFGNSEFVSRSLVSSDRRLRTIVSRRDLTHRSSAGRRSGRPQDGVGAAPDAGVVHLRAEHGCGVLVTVESGGRRAPLLYDTGFSRDTCIHNLDVLGLRVPELRASHPA